MAGNVMPSPKAAFYDNTGAPLNGGKVYFYAAGTTNPQNTFSDSALSSANANPVVLDSRGEATIYLSQLSYKVKLDTSTGTTLWTQDNVAGISLGSDLTSLTTRVTALEAIPLALVCEGRITLTAATPVTIADVTGATSVKFTPYGGSRIALFDGSATWALYTFTELSLSLGTDTASLPYDLFAYNSSGTVTLERLVWTNGTTRATALTTQNGVLVKTGATTRRYLGTYYTSGTGTTEDSDLKRFVWNYYHRHPKRLRAADATVSWAYTTATLRQANAATANKVEVIIGVADVLLDASAYAQIANSAANVAVETAIGEDSTTAGTAGSMMQTGLTQVVNQAIQVSCRLVKFPVVGYHYYAWLEKSAATGTSTWYGTSGDFVGGLLGTIPC